MSRKRNATTWIRTASCSVLGVAALFGKLSEAQAQDVGAENAAETALAPPAPPLGDGTSASVLSSPPVTYEATESKPPAHPPRKYGAMLDVGLPDGIVTSFVFRPLPEARVHAGIGYNGISPGLRLGGEYLPFGWGPSLGLVYGHYFEGDANGLVGSFAGESDENAKELLKSIGYDYVNLRVGMEFGGDRFTFFMRGGISWLHMTIHHMDALLEQSDGAATNGSTTITITEDPVLNAFAPTLNLGLIVQL
jgi:hypothetical protein